jgi:hypothetical protein
MRPGNTRMYVYFYSQTWQPGNMCLYVTITPDIYYFIGDLATRVRLFILTRRPGNMCLLVNVIVNHLFS